MSEKKSYTDAELKELVDDVEISLDNLTKVMSKKDDSFLGEGRLGTVGPDECEAVGVNPCAEIEMGGPTRRELMDAYAELSPEERRVHAECLADVRQERDGVRTTFKGPPEESFRFVAMPVAKVPDVNVILPELSDNSKAGLVVPAAQPKLVDSKDTLAKIQDLVKALEVGGCKASPDALRFGPALIVEPTKV